MNKDAVLKQKAALDAFRNGQIFKPTDEQVKYANLHYSLKTMRKFPEKLLNYKYLQMNYMQQKWLMYVPEADAEPAWV